MTLWALLPLPFVQPYTKKSFPSALHRLAAITLRETWHFGSTPPLDQPYPILWNYLCFTFVRHCKQDVLHDPLPSEAYLRVAADGTWAAFNTGLVNKLYDPVFALFRKDRKRTGPPWVLFDFCVPGQGRAGKDLANSFNPLPASPRYFASSLDMLLDPDQPIHIEADHAIIDGIARNRFPYEFLRQNFQPRPPKGVEWEDYSSYEGYERRAYLQKLAEAVKEDTQAERAIKNRLEDAKELAVKRTRWNYKTAIPQYYPRTDQMSLLLPMCLVNDEKVDVALVVDRLDSDAYQASTVFPLNWAYQNARLVCRPDSDWLMPERITMGSPEEELIEEDAQAHAKDPLVEREQGNTERTVDESLENSWAQFARTHEVGDMVDGTVQNLVSFGAFVDLAEGLTGLLHVSKISDDYVQDPSDLLSVGERLKVQILKFDESARRIDLSMRGIGKEATPDEAVKDSLVECGRGNTERSVDESLKDSWAQFARTHEVDDMVDGTVQNLANYGAFVDLAEGTTGLIHISEISDDYVQHPGDKLHVGEQITVRILGIDESGRRIQLSLRASQKTDDDID